MATRTHIGKVLTTVFWTTAGAGVLVLLVAAIRYRNSNTCKGWHIAIDGGSLPNNRTFVDRRAITDLLLAAGADERQDRPIQSFDLRRLESTLRKDIWIKDAQLFFDNNGILQVRVSERLPAARIFTRDGNSFYVDSAGVQLPLEDQFAARLPVFTDYPASKFRTTGADSALSAGVLRLSSFLRANPFWMAQISQVEITPQKGFELEPAIGDSRVGFGDGNDIEARFRRLYLFYSEVLSRVGMDKYDRIDVSYAGEVVARLKGLTQNRVDSLKGIDNIRQLIRSAQQLQPDTLRQLHTRPLEDHNTMTEQSLNNFDLVPDAGDSSATVPNRKPSKPSKP
jgi:cell division protein FtsQ